MATWLTSRARTWLCIVIGMPGLLVTTLAGAPAAVAASSRGAPTPQASVPSTGSEPVRDLKLGAQVFKGDFDAMLDRRYIRVVVPLSPTLYFNDHGHERGFTAETVRAFERHVNRKYAKRLGKRPLTVIIGAQSRGAMLAEVAAGRADIAAGNLTVTDARRATVDFVVAAAPPAVTEIVLTGSALAPVASADDLAGRTVHVRKSSSYYESLTALNDRLGKAGKRPVRLELVPDELEDEDMMEMLNTGLLGAMVCDDWKAALWSQVLPNIRLNPQAVVRRGGQVGWAIRKDSPQLVRELREFSKEIKPDVLAAHFKQHQRRIAQLHDNTTAPARKRFEATITLFEKYGARYGFDPLLLAAQGYQESQLRQEARGPGGAVGVMQLLPKTAVSLGVGDIRLVEPNIHGAVKYMDRLIATSFQGAEFDRQNRTLFALAAYNAGPTRIAQLRGLAAKRGLDAQTWFNHVEIVASEEIGAGVTTYVRNIYKYYVAYTLMGAMEERRRKARDAVRGER